MKQLFKKIIHFLSKKKTFSLNPEGLSMFPLFHPNEILYYQKTSFNQIKVNDILLIKKNEQLITHRVIYKSKKYLITKGDNNFFSDGKIYPQQIISQVYAFKRQGKIFPLNTFYLLQSSYYLKEIIKVKSLFEKEKIDFVFLKGLPLHLYFKGFYPKRIYADCDVLIDKKDLKKVEKIFLKIGYQKTDFSFSKISKKLKDKETEISYYKITNYFPIVFDVHLEVVFMMTQLSKLEALYPQKLIDQLTKDFLDHKQIVSIEKEKFSILSSENLILYLSLHFFHHNFKAVFRLQFLNDVILFYQKRKVINSQFWINLAKKIIIFQLKNFVYLSFIFLKKYYQTSIPYSFLKKIKPSSFLTNYRIKKILKTNIFDDEPRIKAGINRFKNLFFLSPSLWYKKILVFFSFQVIYSILLVFFLKIKKDLKTIQKIFLKIGNCT